jgi:pimeloyl-ACP methyl ester carboxylesterase
MSRQLSLQGGTGQISVQPDQLERYAHRLTAVAPPLGSAVASATRLLSDPVLIGTGLIDPFGHARLMEQATLVLASGFGLRTGIEALAGTLRVAAGAYRGADDLRRRLEPVGEACWQLPAAAAAFVSRRPWREPGAAIQGAVIADPELGDIGVDLLTAVGAGGMPPRGGTAAVAGRLSVLYRDGSPVLTERPDLPTLDAAGAPRNIADLISGLQLRDETDDGGGLLDVRILDRTSTGSAAPGRRIIVDITGTTLWNFDPWRNTPQATDMSTNLRAVAHLTNVMQRGVLAALERAGVGRDEPILLVGHSQGGLVAAQLAAAITAGGRYTVGAVLTAGAPIAASPVPTGIPVLALENTGDLVPHLDGSDNPRRPDWLTARSSHGQASLLSRHSLQSYLEVAQDVDASTAAPAVRARSELSPFLDATSVSTTVFQVRRAS